MPMSTPDAQAQFTAAALAQLAEVKGQLHVITTLIQNNHEATHQRIDDLRHDLKDKHDGHDRRIGILEQNERGTAIKAGATGALSGLASSALLQGLITLLKGH